QFNRDYATSNEALLAQLQQLVGGDAVSKVDASSLAVAILGDTIGANLFVVGVAAQQGFLPVGLNAIERAIELNDVAVAFNLSAFRLGRLFVTNPDRVVEMATSVQAPKEAMPTTLPEVIAHRMRHLTEYQNAALAERYRKVVEKVRDLEARVVPGSGALALTLAPPFLNGKKVNGRPVKREFGSWILGVMRIMARMRGIRGSWADPFAWTHERRMERALITEYEGLVDDVLASLDTANHSHALTLLSLVDEVRGFGPVKAAAIETYHARVSSAHKEFHRLGKEVPAKDQPASKIEIEPI